MTRVTLTMCAAVFLVAAGTIAAPEQAPQAPLPAPTEERVVVQLVQLPVTATDRQGRPVTDLKKEEIRVKLRGQEPRVVYLDHLSGDLNRASEPVPDVRVFLEAPGGWSEPARSAPSTSALAIVLDNENDGLLRREEALDKLVKFLDGPLDPNLRIAVFSYSGTLQLELPLTTDRMAAKSSVRAASSREGRPRVDPRARMRKLTDQLDVCVTSHGDFTSMADSSCVRDVVTDYAAEMKPRSADFILGLEGVVQYLGGVQGRKNVFVLSHGFPIDLSPVLLDASRAVFGNDDQVAALQSYLGFGDDPRARMDRLIESLIRYQITMTFVDRAPAPSGDTEAARGKAFAPGTSPMRAEYDAAAADTEEIAVSSGGTRVWSPDLSEGLAKAVKAKDGVYELGVQLSTYLEPDKLTKISVSCSRKGVKIRSSRGIYAAPAEAEQQLRGRFAFGKGLPLVGDRAPGIHQSFQLSVDPESIGYDLTETEAQASFTVDLVVVRQSDGRRLADAYHFLEHSYDRKSWDKTDRAPMTLGGWVELPSGDYFLEAWVRNVRSGREGVIRQPVRVPTTFKTAPPTPPAPPPAGNP
jgi:VWFA-related protein